MSFVRRPCAHTLATQMSHTPFPFPPVKKCPISEFSRHHTNRQGGGVGWSVASSEPSAVSPPLMLLNGKPEAWAFVGSYIMAPLRLFSDSRSLKVSDAQTKTKP